MRGLRVLVTGAAGFIGSHLARRLCGDGATVHALVRPGSDLRRLDDVRNVLRLRRSDLLDRRSLRTLQGLRLDAICHCAAVRATREAPVSLRRRVEAEAAMALNLFEATAGCGWRRVVCVGSSYEYGPSPRAHRESDPVAPMGARGLSKAVSSLLLGSLARQAGRESVVLRLFSVYGPGQQPDRLIPRTLRAAWDAVSLPITKEPTFRDLVFIDDAVDAIVRALVAPRVAGRTLNVGGGRMVTNRAVVREIERVTGRRVATGGVYPPTEADLGPWQADVGLARRVLGWRPRYGLRRGLRLTAAWFEAEWARARRAPRARRTR